MELCTLRLSSTLSDLSEERNTRPSVGKGTAVLVPPAASPLIGVSAGGEVQKPRPVQRGLSVAAGMEATVVKVRTGSSACGAVIAVVAEAFPLAV